MKIKLLPFLLVLFGWQVVKAQKIAVLVAGGFNPDEYWRPHFLFRAAGYQLDIISTELGKVEAGSKNRSLDLEANFLPSSINPKDYAGLFIPGGYSPAKLVKSEAALNLVLAFHSQSKPMAAICHGPMLFAHTGLLKGRPSAFLLTAGKELPQDWDKGAFGQYTDQAVVETGNLIMSRYPDDAEQFALAFINKLKGNWPGKPTENLAILGGSPTAKTSYAFDRGSIYGLNLKISREAGGQANYMVIFASNPGKQFFKDTLSAQKANNNLKHIWVIGAKPSEIPKPFGKFCSFHSPDSVEKVFQDLTMQYKIGFANKIQPEDTLALKGKNAAIILESGFSESGLAVCKSALEAGGYHVVLAGMGDKTNLKGSNGLQLKTSLSETVLLAETHKPDMIVLPGAYDTDSASKVYNYTAWQQQNVPVVLVALAALHLPTSSSNRPVSCPEQFKWNLPKGNQYHTALFSVTDKGLYTVQNHNAFGTFLYRNFRP